MKNLLICVTGSVASILLKEIVNYAINSNSYKVKVVLSKNSENFVDKVKCKDLADSLNVEIFTDDHEWNYWSDKKEVLHIELRKWADILLICPLSANTLAKICCGICDNLVTCTIKAWEKSKPVFYALAMNTLMYVNDKTQYYRDILNKEYGWYEIPVTSKKLKCGDIGKGALAQIKDIYKSIDNEVNINRKISFYFKKESKNKQLEKNENIENCKIKNSDLSLKEDLKED